MRPGRGLLPPWLPVLALLAFTASTPVLGQLPQALLAPVIMIQVEANGSAIGTGVVLYNQHDQLTVVTAYHVLYGSGGCSESPRLMNPAWSLDFHSGVSPAATAAGSDRTVFPLVAPAKDEDLILLQVRLPNPPASDLGVEMLDLQTTTYQQAEDRMGVVAVGQHSGAGGSGRWVERRGEIIRIEPERIIHTADIEEGFSGGPLFSDDGKLLGINLCYDKASREGWAVPVGVLLRRYRGLINPLEIRGEVDEAAYQVYRKGLRAVALRRWTEVRKLMQQARDQYPLEGDPVHLRGMRYTRYVPSYYLALAEFREGNCEAAQQAWRAPGLQDGLGGKRRQARLNKMRRICRSRP